MHRRALRRSRPRAQRTARHHSSQVRAVVCRCPLSRPAYACCGLRAHARAMCANRCTNCEAADVLIKYKTQMCRFSVCRCPQGDECLFAHDHQELRGARNSTVHKVEGRYLYLCKVEGQRPIPLPEVWAEVPWAGRSLLYLYLRREGALYTSLPL